MLSDGTIKPLNRAEVESRLSKPRTVLDAHSYREREALETARDLYDSNERLTVTVDHLERDRDHWKANHDSQVHIKRNLHEKYTALLAENRAMAYAAVEYRACVNEFAAWLDSAIPQSVKLPDDGGRFRAAAIKLKGAITGELTTAEVARVKGLEAENARLTCAGTLVRFDDAYNEGWTAGREALEAENERLEGRVRELEGVIVLWQYAKTEAYKKLCHDECMYGKGFCKFEAICDVDIATAKAAKTEQALAGGEE